MKNDVKVFIDKLYLIIIILIALCLLGLFLITYNSYIIFKLSIVLFLLILITCIISILWFLYILYKALNSKKISRISQRILKKVIELIYPVTLTITKLVKGDVDSIRRFYSNINNLLVKTQTYKINREDLLILLPHCLQDSECKIKITNDINNCRKCGKCSINQIIELCDKYNVKAVVATGGTLAREWIKKMKPKCIIAVACERDLSSGINEVKLIPVIGVLNERPNGPCYNTKVSLEELEKAIKFFVEEI